jgi:hypothetical protein
MLSSSPCSSCTPGRSSSPTEGWCASPSRCLFAFAGRVDVLRRVSAFLLAQFNRAVCLPFSGAASLVSRTRAIAARINLLDCVARCALAFILLFLGKLAPFTGLRVLSVPQGKLHNSRSHRGRCNTRIGGDCLHLNVWRRGGIMQLR